MKKHKTPVKSSNSESEDKIFKAQKKVFYEYLLDKIATASMVTEATGIPQKSITRYKREFEDLGLLIEVEEKPCKHTKHKAWYITTNKALFLKKSPQLNLFDL
jgi:hypothetical protein